MLTKSLVGSGYNSETNERRCYIVDGVTDSIAFLLLNPKLSSHVRMVTKNLGPQISLPNKKKTPIQPSIHKFQSERGMHTEGKTRCGLQRTN